MGTERTALRGGGVLGSRGAPERTAFRRVLLSGLLFGLLTTISHAGVAWPLRLSADGRLLLDQNGVPFLMVGDAGWSMTVNLAPADIDRYLSDRAAKGFNTIILRGIDVNPAWGGPADYQGEEPFVGGTYDWTVRNEPYWQTLDRILTGAKSRDMLVLLAPAYLGFQCGSEGWCVQMRAQSDAVMVDYGRWVGARYRGSGNILWIDGGDCDATQYGTAMDRVVAVRDGIVSADPGSLRTGHTGRNDAAAIDYPWIDTHPAYSDCSLSSQRLLDEYGRLPARPVFLIEARYENEGASTECLASQAMWSFLGGGVGHVFGNNPVWSYGPGWDGPGGIESIGSIQMSNIGRLMRSRAWWTLKPDYDHTVVTSGFGAIGTPDYVAAARADDGQTVMAHLPTFGAAITVDMTRIADAFAETWWFDPATGIAEWAGSFPTTGTRTFTSSRANQTLVIDAAGAGLPAPGTTVFPPPIPLAPVQNLSLPKYVRLPRATDVTFRWSVVPGASAYRIYRSGNAAGPWNEVVDAGSPCFDTDGDAMADTCEYTWARLPAWRSDYFTVTGYSGASESPLH